jgi:hypothetical protein
MQAAHERMCRAASQRCIQFSLGERARKRFHTCRTLRLNVRNLCVQLLLSHVVINQITYCLQFKKW